MSNSLSDSLMKVPPQDEGLEATVLGMALLQSGPCQEAIELLTKEDFFKNEHMLIFEAMTELSQEGAPISMRSVVSKLKTTNKLMQAGGAFMVAELTSRVASSADIRYYSLILKEFRIKRDIIALCGIRMREAYRDDVDALTLLSDLEKDVQSVAKALPAKAESTIREGLDQLTKLIQLREETQSEITGIPSGFPKLDKITAGWQDSDLIILAARPGMGKTALLLQMAINQAVDFKLNIGIFSMEMSHIQLTKRAASISSDIPLRDIISKRFTDIDWNQYMHKTARLASSKMWIDDASSLTAFEFRSRARRMVVENNIKIIYVDYLQLMKGDKNAKNEEQEISQISRELKGVAKELNIPIIALAQLSRAVETRGGDKRPMMSDLRSSGSIEANADLVVFLWRAEYYHVSEGEGGPYIPGMTEVIVAKHRNGDTATIPLQFIGKHTKFVHTESAYQVYDSDHPKPVEEVREFKKYEPPSVETPF